MAYTIADGVWPTMITPFTQDRAIDYSAVDRLIEWYLERGVAGLFAVCLSSEMFHLSLRERTALAHHVVTRVRGRVPVIASGHVSDDYADQVDEIRRIGETGVAAAVLVTNRLASPTDGEQIFEAGISRILDGLPETLPLGLYECPVPYKRVLSPGSLAFCASTGRFHFLKDTCCDPDLIASKLSAVGDTSLRIFNANAATLLTSLETGVAGYSGVMANMHPELYVWLCRNWREQPEQAQAMQDFVGLASLVERQSYPTNAKYYLQLEGLPVGLTGRKQPTPVLTAPMRMEVEQLRRASRRMRDAVT